MARSGAGPAGITVQPSLFDMFYEEFLAQFMSAADPNEISQEFMKLKTDIERADFIMRLPFVRDFEIKNKAGIKCIEKAVRYREEETNCSKVISAPRPSYSTTSPSPTAPIPHMSSSSRALSRNRRRLRKYSLQMTLRIKTSEFLPSMNLCH